MNLQRADNEWRYDPVDEAWTLVARNRRLLRPREAEATSEPPNHSVSAATGRTKGLSQIGHG